MSVTQFRAKFAHMIYCQMTRILISTRTHEDTIFCLMTKTTRSTQLTQMICFDMHRAERVARAIVRTSKMAHFLASATLMFCSSMFLPARTSQRTVSPMMSEPFLLTNATHMILWFMKFKRCTGLTSELTSPLCVFVG